jgi:DNA-binding NarL/FixJ family response regulator
MSEHSTAGGCSGTKVAQTGSAVALIASGVPGTELARVLHRENVGFIAFDDVESALNGECDASLILLWSEDVSQKLLTCVEPLTQHVPDASVIIVCSQLERWGVRAALMAGAAGIVLHEDIEVALRPCMEAVQADQTCVPREHWRQIDPPVLSSREKQILGLVVMGYSNGKIAEQLFLAESTVKSHLSSAFGKLGVRSRNDAVHLILDPGSGFGVGILALDGESLKSSPELVP